MASHSVAIYMLDGTICGRGIYSAGPGQRSTEKLTGKCVMTFHSLYFDPKGFLFSLQSRTRLYCDEECLGLLPLSRYYWNNLENIDNEENVRKAFAGQQFALLS